MTPGEQVSIPLALFDFVPVVFGALGGFIVARRIGWLPAYVGATLVFVGGFAKATWKLLAASDVADIPRLADGLFPLMGCGFLLLAAAAWGVRNLAVALLLMGLAAVGVAVPAIADWYLIAVILGSTALYAALARDAWKVRDVTTVALLAVCLVAAYTLGPLAGREQTLSLQWLEQSINAVGQAAFALAAWRLTRVVRSDAARDGTGVLTQHSL
ncbi:hypothetical protein [Gordonia terrae]|uniref:DUF4203 domain-containing protein n=1 Tax=Gordonia terrae NBRC 100016 TaxID=1089454 RepID=A0ABQ0HFL1_9ACTN|nr:hypothetical protein [Gordonia terrae]GAB44677.1 hypothetical protein GOTRE_071_00030 [Gordonia terrae NBRC 100016]VTR09055.1 Uncharacterised protein [Clostridioides difficile]VTS20423.1 Uncharacterised protein [Gordonia terrae]